MHATEQRKSVLVVDDDRDVRALVRESITRVNRNAVVVESDNGADALIRAGRQRFDLVITDIKMPKKDGSRLIEGLVALSKELKPGNVIILSAHCGEGDVKIPAGIRAIRKPCTDDELRAAISQALPAAPGGATPQKHLVELISNLAKMSGGVLEELGISGAQQEKPFVLSAENQLTGGLALVDVVDGPVTGRVGIWIEDGVLEQLESRNVSSPGGSDWCSTALSMILSRVRVALDTGATPLGKTGEIATPAAVEGGPYVVIPFSSEKGKVGILTAVRATSAA